MNPQLHASLLAQEVAKMRTGCDLQAMGWILLRECLIHTAIELEKCAPTIQVIALALRAR